jgi:hypothetical protein
METSVFFIISTGKWGKIIYNSGRDSVVGAATDYGLDGPAVEARCGRDWPRCPPSILHDGHGVLSGGKATEAWC